MKTPPRAARPRSPRRTGHFLERRAGRGSWPATPRLEVGVRSNGADASVARRRDVSSPTRANQQMSCRCRPAGVLPIVPPPRCAGATRDSFLAMPARSKRSLAALAQHAAAKKPKLEPEKPPPQSMKRCRFGYPKPAECDSLPPLEDEIKCMRPPDLYEVVCQLSPTEMWYHLRFVPMQEAAAAQKRAAAEKLNVVHECTNQCAQVGFYNN